MRKTITKLKSLINNTEFILLLIITVLGGFNEYISCISSFLLIINIVCKSLKRKEITFKINLLSCSVAILIFFYLISGFWAFDSGMAFIGFLKYLPLLLFLVSVYQEEKFHIEAILPYFVSFLIIVSVIGMQIKPIKSFFTVADRFAGNFQYPNTFALLIIVSELFLLKSEKLKIQHYILIALFTLALLYTGSRTAFVLFVVSNIAVLFLRSKKTAKRTIIISLIFASIILILLFIFSKNIIIQRYFRISVLESTFVGRLLYFKDALPLLIKYPFGMGFLGYSYIQHSIQTGIYTIRYIHNDFLQIILDVGWIPAIAFVSAIVYSFISKKIDIHNKIIIAVIVLHSCFDFNLQFISISFILILLIDTGEGKEIKIKSGFILNLTCLLLAVLNLYMSIALALAHFGQNTAAEEMCSFNTENKISMLKKEEDINTANAIADAILKQNTTTFIPYVIKAKYCYSDGDFSGLIENKNIIFEKNPFDYEEYEEYCQMLINGIALYSEEDDTDSVLICQKELLSAKSKLAENNSRLSDLGKKIKEQPVTRLSKEVLDYISKIEAAGKIK